MNTSPSCSIINVEVNLRPIGAETKLEVGAIIVLFANDVPDLPNEDKFIDGWGRDTLRVFRKHEEGVAPYQAELTWRNLVYSALCIQKATGWFEVLEFTFRGEQR